MLKLNTLHPSTFILKWLPKAKRFNKTNLQVHIKPTNIHYVEAQKTLDV